MTPAVHLEGLVKPQPGVTVEYGKVTATTDMRVTLPLLWVFYVLNILYADVFNLMGETATTTAENAEIVETLLSPEMLLGAAIFLEMAMAMVILSRFLGHRLNRWANMVVATLHVLGVSASLFVGTPAMSYVFFVIVEIATLVYIVWCAWNWNDAM